MPVAVAVDFRQQGNITILGDAEDALQVMQRHSATHDAAIIGTVTEAHPGIVEIRRALGGGRILDLLSGEQMPRIC